MEAVALALLVSVDNVRLAGVLGLLEAARRRWWHLALLIAAFEGAFPLLGAAVGTLPFDVMPLERIAPVVLVGAAVVSMVYALERRMLPLGPALYALPALFALDNLLAGAALRPLGITAVSSALLLGAASGAASLVTMAVVGRLAGRWRERRAWAPSAVALAMGASILVIP